VFGDTILLSIYFLYARRIQHHADLSSDRCGRQVTSESASDNTIGSMCSANFAPVDSEFVSKLVGNLRLRDKGNLLSKVKVRVHLRVDTFNFDQTDTAVLGPKTTLVTKDGTINVKFRWSGRHDDYCAANGKRKRENKNK
jgi:hypothetical protein